MNNWFATESQVLENGNHIALTLQSYFCNASVHEPVIWVKNNKGMTTELFFYYYHATIQDLIYDSNY
jgi:hypothetical protein